MNADADLPLGWGLTTLGDIAWWGSGGTPSRANSALYGGSVYWFKTGELGPRLLTKSEETITETALRDSSAKLFPVGSVALAMYGATIGKVSILGVAAATNQACAVGRPNPTATCSDFLYYFLRSQKDAFVAAGQGGAQPNISQSVVKGWQVSLPPLTEQLRIIDKLDTVLARVDAVNDRFARVALLLKRFRKSVLAAAFTGKLTQEFRALGNLSSAKDAIRAVGPIPRPNRYNSRTDAVIAGDYALSINLARMGAPVGWAWVPLVDVARMESGHTPSRSESTYWGGDVSWIGIADARAHHSKTIDQTLQHTNSLGLANSAARLLPAGTVCVSRTASVGYVVKMGRPMATSQDFVNWTCTSAIDADWLKWLFLAEGEALPRFGKGSTHTTIYFPEWLSLHVALPPIEEQLEIVRRVELLFAYADRLEARLQAAQTAAQRLTPSLLAKAFRGELVPQDPNDEPAAELLKRLAAQREAAPAKTRKTKTKSAV